VRRRPGIILCYHRVASLPDDPASLAVSPARFAEQVAALAGVVEMVPLAEVGRRSTPTVAITFDDGYADVSEAAVPILAEHGVPATVFVVTGALAPDRVEFWWDRLEHLLLDGPVATPAIVLEEGDLRLRVDVRSDAGRRRGLKVLSHRLRRQPAERIARLMAEIERQTGRSPEPCDRHRRMTVDQLREVAHTAVIEVGSHTHSHSMLTALGPTELERELTTSRVELGALVSRPVTSCAYPFGDAQSFDQRVAAAARAAGYQRACVNVGGRVRRSTDPYLLPRHEVYDWTAPELISRVRGWLGS